MSFDDYRRTAGISPEAPLRRLEAAYNAGKAELEQQLQEAQSYYATRLENHDKYVDELENQLSNKSDVLRTLWNMVIELRAELAEAQEHRRLLLDEDLKAQTLVSQEKEIKALKESDDG